MNLVRAGLDRAGYTVYRRPHLPKGADVFLSLRSHWPDWRPVSGFDVGANVGQTVGRLRPLYPELRLHAFEPAPAAFARLRTACASDPLTVPHCRALSDKEGEALLEIHAYSEQSSLEFAAGPATAGASTRIPVQLATVDSEAARLGLARLDLLKIDVEGHELSVLAGARGLLERQAIDVLVLEAGLMPGHPRFTPLDRLLAALQPHDYWLVGIYEQFGVRFLQTAEFANALFVHRRLLTASTDPLLTPRSL